MAGRQLAAVGRLVLVTASDGWEVRRRRAGEFGWGPVLVRGERRAELALGLRAKGVAARDAVRLVAGLPATYAEWKAGEVEGK